MKISIKIFIFTIILFSLSICLISFLKDTESIRRNVQDSVPVSDIIEKIQNEEAVSSNVNQLFLITVDIEEALNSVTSDLVVSLYLARIGSALAILMGVLCLYFCGIRAKDI